VTSYPHCFKIFAAPIPETPDPITATRISQPEQSATTHSFFPAHTTHLFLGSCVKGRGKCSWRLKLLDLIAENRLLDPQSCEKIFTHIYCFYFPHPSVPFNRYRIKSKCSSSPSGQGKETPFSEYSVFREYKHFQQLHHALIVHFPGIIIPFLPSRPSSNTGEHISDLRTKLQSFLQDLIAHPILKSSSSLRIFFQGSLEQFHRNYRQSREDERQRRSTIYLPTLRERMENKLDSFLNGDEVCSISLLLSSFAEVFRSESY
jgi:hypothetical protein